MEVFKQQNKAVLLQVMDNLVLPHERIIFDGSGWKESSSEGGTLLIWLCRKYKSMYKKWQACG